VGYYGAALQQALATAWSAANGICAKRLVPFLPEFVPTLERHGHPSITDEVRRQLLQVSPATVDRLLSPLRHPHGLTTTKPGRLLKHQIPVRTFTEWTDVKPGFLEADLVAHCGGATDGSFLYTLTLTDVATTWTECLLLLHRSQHGVVHALQRARNLFPFPLLGIDTDNGGEFINEELMAYCAGEQLTFTRGRVANKNHRCMLGYTALDRVSAEPAPGAGREHGVIRPSRSLCQPYSQRCRRRRGERGQRSLRPFPWQRTYAPVPSITSAQFSPVSSETRRPV
jgi:hypothetical protein